jgi:hypothetical protein
MPDPSHSTVVPAIAASDASPQIPNRPMLAVFRSVQAAIRLRMLAGHNLDEVEDDLIDPAPLSSDWKAALWLAAWSLQPPSHQLAEVEAHVELLSRRGT